MASKTGTPPPQNPSRPQSTRPSTSIQKGADLIQALIEEEKARLAQTHQKQIHDLQTRFAQYRKKVEAEKAAAALHKVLLNEEKVDSAIIPTTAPKESPDARHNRDHSAGTEVTRLKDDLENMEVALGEIGMTYVDGTIKFKSEHTEAVAQVIRDIRKQRTEMEGYSNIIGAGDNTQEPSCTKPSEFLTLFMVILEQDRRVMQSLLAKIRALEEERKLLQERMLSESTFECCIGALQTDVSLSGATEQANPPPALAQAWSSLNELLEIQRRQYESRQSSKPNNRVVDQSSSSAS